MEENTVVKEVWIEQNITIPTFMGACTRTLYGCKLQQ